MSFKKITRAFLSVWDKKNLLTLGKYLNKQNIEIISTGGSAKLLEENGIPVKEVSNYTDFPEIFSGRVKSLHPKIYGGILARRGIDDLQMQENFINPIDLVVVNLYPFSQTRLQTKDLNFLLENIDIGGPSLIRAAAKNYQDVCVLTNPEDYGVFLENINEANEVDLNFRFDLAKKAFAMIAQYDDQISTAFSSMKNATSFPDKILPDHINIQYKKEKTLRYGENSHQLGALYLSQNKKKGDISSALKIQGKELSFNNLADADAALSCVKIFQEPTCVIVKHANPCGVASDVDLKKAYQKAFSTDPTSSFGGIIAFNKELDANCIETILKNQFVELIVAPKVLPEARQIALAKKNVRILETGFWQQNICDEFVLKKISGGLLVQQEDNLDYDPKQIRILTKKEPTKQEFTNAVFAWRVAKFVKSNAIVYAKNNMTLGIGAGQMSRVDSAKIALEKAKIAKFELLGSSMASDAFFPFRDSIDAAAKENITCIISPGGSIRDSEIIEAANEHKISLIFTGIRHFKH